MLYDFIRFAGLPAKTRAVSLYRDVRLLPVCLGHLRLIDVALPSGLNTPGDYILLSCLLAVPPRRAKRLLTRGRLPLGWRRLAPRNADEMATLSGYLADAWKCPDRYREQTRGRQTRGPHEREYASSSALRLMARLARVPGIGRLLAGQPLEDVPVQDALAWIVTDDELQGAHYMSADTDAHFQKIAERADHGAK